MSAVHQPDFILGGVRSGKSREALRLAAASPRASRTGSLATARVGDPDMTHRLVHHRAEGPEAGISERSP